MAAVTREVFDSDQRKLEARARAVTRLRQPPVPDAGSRAAGPG